MQRVKILFNKKDSALIQMADMNQAQLGKMHTETSLTAQQLLSRLSLHASQIQLSCIQALKMMSNQNRHFISFRINILGLIVQDSFKMKKKFIKI